MSTNLTDIFKKTQESGEELDINQMGLAVEEARVRNNYRELEERNKLEKMTSEIDLSLGNEKYIKKLKKDNNIYMEGLKNSKVFINNDFRHLVPYHPGSLTLIAANTGDGKSTCAANLAYHDLVQGKNVIVISNEEKATDFYNRVTSIIKLWNYQNHQDFKEEQKRVFEEYIGILANKMTVVDNDYHGEPGQTTTIEGFKAILDKLLVMAKKGIVYDTVIIDYYQNIGMSTRNPKLVDWEVQAKVAKLLDAFKNSYPAPIVVLAQKKASTGDNELSFKELIQGRKIILDVCTCAIELKADRENYKTDWTIRKSRFSAGAGQTISTGYKFGRYVQYSQDFKEEMQRIKIERQMNTTLKIDMDKSNV